MNGININELSSVLDLSTNTIRQWESFYRISTPRNSRGNRHYPDDIINLFKKIKCLVESTKSREEIKALLLLENSSYMEVEVSSMNNQSKIEIFETKYEDKESQNYNLVVKPFTDRITTLEMATNALTVENKELNRTLGRYEGELSKYNEIITLKDSIITDKETSINELKAKLQEAENKINLKWYKFW